MHPNDALHMSDLGRRIAVRMDRVAAGDAEMASVVAADLRCALHNVIAEMTLDERQQLGAMISSHLLPLLSPVNS